MTSQTANPSPAPAAHNATPPTESRVRRRPATVLSKLGETLAALFALAIAGGLWYLGAQFTLLALETIGIPVTELGHWRWLIPAGISAVELRWWPRAIAEAKAISFAAAPLINASPPTAAAVISRDMPENGAENLQSAETHFPASGSDSDISEGIFSLEEIAQIAAMIARGGKGKTEIVQAMLGYSGRKHRVYAAYYDRVREAIELISDQPYR